MAKQILHILGTAQSESTSMAHIVRSLAASLDPDRFRMHALFLAGPGPLAGALESAGVPSFVINWQRGMRDPFGALRFWRFIDRQRYDIVHLHYGGRAVARLARTATKVRIVRHLHGRILEPKGLEQVTYSAKGYDAVVAVSKAVAVCVTGGKAQVIYTGVDTPPEPPKRPRSESKLIVGTAGRLVKLKGIEYLLNAAARLVHEFPALEIQVAGSGPELSDLEAEVARLGLSDRVKFLGWVEDVNTVFCGWDVFVMPSLEEGFPVAALDAMASGLPVLATTVGGVPELIEDGKSGLLVEPGDLEALTAAIGVLLRDSELRLRLGTAGFERVRDHFSTAQMARKFSNLYEELLNQKSR